MIYSDVTRVSFHISGACCCTLVTVTECEVMLASLAGRKGGMENTFKTVFCCEMTLPSTAIKVRCEKMT